MALPAGRKGVRADQVKFDGTLNVNTDPYELPIASADSLGGVKVGTGLSISAEGVLSASSDSYLLYETEITIATITAKTITVGTPIAVPEALVGKKIISVCSGDNDGYVVCLGVCRTNDSLAASGWIYPMLYSDRDYTNHTIKLKFLYK